MPEIIHRVAVWVFQLGGAGLLLVGIADSSPLTMPLANDLLMIALSASHHELMPYYATMAAVGSIIGCAITDAVGRKAGEEVQEKVTSRTLAVTALLPPPFPFTPFVAVAAGTRYPRQKLLTIVGLARLGRFLAEGTLAIGYGRRILGLARSPVLKYSVIALIVVATAGSGWTVWRWIRPARSSRRGREKAGGERSKTAHAA